MMGSDDHTIRLLTEMRDEIRTTNARLDKVNENLGALDRRIDQTRGELLDRMRESELRQSTWFTEFTHSNMRTNEMISGHADLVDRVTQCEIDIAELRRRNG